MKIYAEKFFLSSSSTSEILPTGFIALIAIFFLFFFFFHTRGSSHRFYRSYWNFFPTNFFGFCVKMRPRRTDVGNNFFEKKNDKAYTPSDFSNFFFYFVATAKYFIFCVFYRSLKMVLLLLYRI